MKNTDGFCTTVTCMEMGSQSDTEWGHSATAQLHLSVMLKCYYWCNCTVFSIAVTFTHSHHCPLMRCVSLCVWQYDTVSTPTYDIQRCLRSFSCLTWNWMLKIWNSNGFFQRQNYTETQKDTLLGHVSSHRWHIGPLAIFCRRGLPLFLCLPPPRSLYHHPFLK